MYKSETDEHTRGSAVFCSRTILIFSSPYCDALSYKYCRSSLSSNDLPRTVSCWTDWSYAWTRL